MWVLGIDLSSRRASVLMQFLIIVGVRREATDKAQWDNE